MIQNFGPNPSFMRRRHLQQCLGDRNYAAKTGRCREFSLYGKGKQGRGMCPEEIQEVTLMRPIHGNLW